MLRYIIRAFKYLLMVCVLLAIIVLIMFYATEHPANIMPWELFKGNYTRLIVFLVVLSAVYPAIGYMKKDIYVNTDFTGNSAELDNIMKELHFERAGTTPDGVTYRHRSAFVRFMRTFEDKITFTFSQGKITAEGLRKEVVRIARNIEYFETSKKENE